MLFNTWTFGAFLVITLAVYWSLPRRGQNYWLLLAGYVFYGWWDWRFLILLWITTVVDYFVAHRIHEASDVRVKRRWLTFGLSVGLGILGVFKYFDFFSISFARLMGVLGWELSPFLLNVILPVGVSFYTFQSLAYTIDVYRGRVTPSRDPLDYAVFVAFFPQLEAGPIERAQNMLPQIGRERSIDYADIQYGVWLILIGLVKKMAVADLCAPVVQQLFDDPAAYARSDLLLGIYLFSLQIYGDFSGYTDIARGCARLMGFQIMLNFRQPYFSKSVGEFWERWHISLSTWLRDYLYISLGGNRRGTRRTYWNLFVTMLLGGLWHGANWTFVVWGVLHGSYLALHRRLFGAGGKRRRDEAGREGAVGLVERLWRLVSVLVTFHCVALAWVFFRAETIHGARDYLVNLVHSSAAAQISWTEPKRMVPVVWLFGLDLWFWLKDDDRHILMMPSFWRGLLFGILLVILIIWGSSAGDVPFIYFQF
ncbi:MAG TPA: membrane-bound O-acyltransferase family protein [Armatimonadetes bacterium]|mgnify:FL=1|nr:membrane-bound O-acyltransferase family protein [Armatimonadota bacterium]